MGIDWDGLVIGPCVAVFGVGDRGNSTPIPYTSTQDGSEFLINGVFDEAYIEVQAFDGTPLSDVAPVLGVQLSSFPPGIQPRQGDTMAVSNQRYVVGDVDQDGHGWAILKLNRIAVLP